MKATLPYSSEGSSRVYLVSHSIMGIPDEAIMGLAQGSEVPGPHRLPQMFRLSHVTGVPTSPPPPSGQCTTPGPWAGTVDDTPQLFALAEEPVPGLCHSAS